MGECRATETRSSGGGSGHLAAWTTGRGPGGVNSGIIRFRLARGRAIGRVGVTCTLQACRRQYPAFRCYALWWILLFAMPSLMLLHAVNLTVAREPAR